MTSAVAPSSIDRLRRMRLHAARGLPLEPSDATWFIHGLDFYFAKAAEGLPIAKALGLAVPPGGMPWWRREALAARDAALRQVAAIHYGSLGPSDSAGAIATGLRRYAASAWPHDRAEASCPTRHAGQPEEWFFRALQAMDVVPDKRQVMRILSKARDIGSAF